MLNGPLSLLSHPTIDVPLISAHRCNTDRLLDKNIEYNNCHYIEFDLQASRDGKFFLYHDQYVKVPGYPDIPVAALTFEQISERVENLVTFEQALEKVANSNKKLHLDLKMISPKNLRSGELEVQATRQAMEAMGPDNMIVTSMEDISIAAIRDWSMQTGHNFKAGLSLGRDLKGYPKREILRIRKSELYPAKRLKRCRANLLVPNFLLANFTLLRYAQRQDIPILVWTVNDLSQIYSWLHETRAWMITTDFPGVAAKMVRLGLESKPAPKVFA